MERLNCSSYPPPLYLFQVYYYNRRTKMSQWEHPHEKRDEAAKKKREEAQKQEWNQYHDDETNKPFWEHKKTLKVQWEDPHAKKSLTTKWQVEQARRQRDEAARKQK